MQLPRISPNGINLPRRASKGLVELFFWFTRQVRGTRLPVVRENLDGEPESHKLVSDINVTRELSRQLSPKLVRACSRGDIREARREREQETPRGKPEVEVVL